MYKQDLALNYTKRLICHQTKQKQISYIYIYIYIYILDEMSDLINPMK